MSQHLAQDTRFRETRLRAGYAAYEVELFVEAVEDALRSASPRLDSSDVAWQRFTPVMMKPGYRMDDVDDYLEDAERVLRERETR
jgi:DivIVA domain-containing protein